MKKVFTKKNFFVILSICLIFLATVSVLQGVKNAIAYHSPDFQYDSFKIFSMRINPYDETISPSGISEDLGLSRYYGRLEANQFPSFLAMMMPMAVFSPSTAYIVWCGINLVLTAFLLVLSQKLFFADASKKPYFILCCLMLAGLGWRNNIGMGQHTIFSAFFFVLALYLSQKEHRIFSGIALAISFFKYTLTVPLALFFVYKRKYKELLISVGIHIGLTIFSAFWIKDSIINLLLKPLKITTWLGNEGYIDFGAIFKLQGYASLVVTGVFMITYLVISVLCSKKAAQAQTDNYVFLALLCYLSLVVTYHRSYDFFVWIIPCMIFTNNYFLTGKQKFEMVASVLLFCYSNFFSKFKHEVQQLFPGVTEFLTAFDYLLAVLTYAFIIFLTIRVLTNKEHTLNGLKNGVCGEKR